MSTNSWIKAKKLISQASTSCGSCQQMVCLSFMSVFPGFPSSAELVQRGLEPGDSEGPEGLRSQPEQGFPHNSPQVQADPVSQRKLTESGTSKLWLKNKHTQSNKPPVLSRGRSPETKEARAGLLGSCWEVATEQPTCLWLLGVTQSVWVLP